MKLQVFICSSFVKLHVYEQKKEARGLQVELKEDDSMKMTLLLQCYHYSFRSSMMCASTMVAFK